MTDRSTPSSTDASRNRRWWLLLPALGAAIWLALFGDKTPTGAAMPGVPTHSAVSAVVPRAPNDGGLRSPHVPAPIDVLEALVPRDELIPTRSEATSPRSRDLFAIRTWNPPPPPAPSGEPAPPVAPPLPYIYVGKKQEGQIWEVYLVRGDQTFIVRDGQTIEGQYKVEHIVPPVLTLTYLPLRQAQSLTIGDAF